MNRRTSYLILLGIPILTLVGPTTINSIFHSARRARQSRHEQETAIDTKAWGRDEAARKLKAHEEGLKRSREYRQQLNEAWGDPVQAAWKNPYLSIEQMLGQLGRACAPAGTQVDVRVDRFTEFEVTLGLDRDAEVGELAQISLCMMQHGSPFVRNLRFTRAGRLLAELETAELDAKRDWAKASQAEIEKYLSMSKDALPKKANALGTSESANWVSRLQTRIKEVSASAEKSELTGDSRRLVDAKSAFNRLLNENTQRLTSLLQKQNEAGDLSNAYRL